MAQRRGGPFQRVRGVRRKTEWVLGPGQDTAQTEVTSSTQILGNLGSQANIPGLTLVRTRGQFLAYLNSASAQNDGFNGAFGMCIVSENAFDAGVASVPHPLDDADWDGWYYHRHLFLEAAQVMNSGAASDIDVLNPVTAAIRFEIDSKAMRKFEVDDVSIGVLDVNLVGTAVMRWHFNTRELLKLS